MINQTERAQQNAPRVCTSGSKPNAAHIMKQMEVLEATNQDLRKLSVQLLQLQDQERRTIARHLNDATGQELAALSVKLAVIFRSLGSLNVELANGLLEAIGLAKHVADELRTISYVLHPPLLDEMGLPIALRWYLDGFGKQSNIRVEFDLSENFGRLPRNLEIAIFRVAQECLTHIHRHARSSTAAVRLHQSEDSITLEVHDHRAAILEEDVSHWKNAGGVGLRSIQERVKDFHGEMEIAALRDGTQVKVSIPIPKPSGAL